jgi:uncharacterized protein with von Willebrand factor type A (vWA) domain
LIEEIKLTISALESGIVEKIVNEAIATHQSLMQSDSNSAIKTSLISWKNKIKKQLKANPIDESIENEIDYYQEVKQYDKALFERNINEIIINIGENSFFYTQANKLANQQMIENNPLFQRHFCEQWYQTLLNSLKDDRLKKVEKEKLLADLYQRSETISKLNEIEGDIDEQKNLRLWDMAKSKLSKRDITQLSKITQFLQKNNELHNIAKKLGRMATQVENSREADVEIESIKKIETTSTCTAGNITGIHNSNDLERLLTTETMFLATPELETIFYKRFADKNLSTYQLQETEQINRKVTSIEKQSSQVTEDKGPFIVAIDASGSMMGLPEQYAKAFAYGLMQIALAENRDCTIIIFSTQLITYELTKENGLSEALSFLSYSFNGGTDISIVLEKSIEIMNSEKYINSDLIIISDFIAPPQPKSMLDKLTVLKTRKNRFHALNLSRYGNPQLLAIFDHYWQYTPSRISRLKQRFKIEK